MALYNKDKGEYIDWFIEIPLKTWWKARKCFRMPKPELHFFKDIYKNCPYASINAVAKILDIRSCDVGWKDKYETPRHERDPYIWVCFFKKFGFSINFKVWFKDNKGEKRDGGMFYWEYLLDYLYYRKDINKIDQWGNDDYMIPTKQFSLKNNLLNH